ncbi:MAG TPA: hypothetical protein VGH38_20655 [Bryobacteraceae bacterium]
MKRNSRRGVVGVALAALWLQGGAHAAVPTGPNPGQAVPDFRLQDQNGAAQTLHSVLGPKGALLVFYRSADW